MRIGVFVVDVAQDGGGLETYQVELVRALARIDRANEYLVYCTAAAAPDVIGVRQDNVTYRVLQPGSRWISLPVSLPLQLVRDGVDFFHATMVPPPLSPKPYLLSILCFSNWAHPEFYPKNVVRRLNFLLGIGIRKAEYLLCNSANLLEDIHRAFGVPRERLAVTHLGVNPTLRQLPPDEVRSFVAERYGIERPYVLFVGKHQERKNVMRVIRGYAAYREATRSDAALVLVGRAPEPGPIDDLIRELGLEEHVMRLAYVPFGDLPWLYGGARIFLFPSLWEGFGLPVIESMACGTPVLCSNVTSLPEVAGDAAIIVEPESVEQIAEGMIRFDTDPAFRAEMVRRGLERAKLFTWENCARATLDYYERMHAG